MTTLEMTDLPFSLATTVTWLENATTSNVTSYERPAVYWVARDIRIVMLPIIILLGTVGNGLTFLVLIRRRMRGTSVYFYLTVLSCMDTIVLYISGFKTWIMEISGYELLRVSDASCKIVMFLLLISWYTSSWLIVLLTVDRCVAVCFPLKAAWMCTVRHAYKLTAGLIIFIALYNLHVFWTFGLFPSNGRMLCCGNPKIPFMEYPFEVFKLASYCFLPFILVLSMNCAIIFQIRMTRNELQIQNTQTSRTGDNNSNTGSHTHRRVTYMLLTVSFTWFFMMAPFALQIFIKPIYRSYMGRTIIFLLMYLNHSVNFFLYCVMGRRFRHELRELFRCRKHQKPRAHFEMKSKTTSRSLIPVDEKIPLKVTLANCNGNSSDL